MLVDVIEHLLRPVVKLSCHIDIHFKVYTENRLELPQCKNNRTFCIVNIRDGIGNCSLCTDELEFRHLLGIIFLLCLIIVLHGILIYLLVYIECLLGKQGSEIRILDLCHHIQTGCSCLFYCKLHVKG